MTVAERTARAPRASATQQLILSTAERLFAEHGVLAVSNRQISEAAGQGNNAAVGYHFGTKTDLVRAIARKHTEEIEDRRAQMVTQVGESTEVRAWVACLIRPVTEHLDALGAPTWFARFNAQVMTDPVFREIVAEESLTSSSLLATVDGLNRCLPTMPAEVRVERGDMARQLMVHMVAERERALAEGTPTPRSTWDEAASGIVDALVGLWTAPVTEEGGS